MRRIVAPMTRCRFPRVSAAVEIGFRTWTEIGAFTYVPRLMKRSLTVLLLLLALRTGVLAELPAPAAGEARTRAQLDAGGIVNARQACSGRMPGGGRTSSSSMEINGLRRLPQVERHPRRLRLGTCAHLPRGPKSSSASGRCTTWKPSNSMPPIFRAISSRSVSRPDFGLLDFEGRLPGKERNLYHQRFVDPQLPTAGHQRAEYIPGNGLSCGT